MNKNQLRIVLSAGTGLVLVLLVLAALSGASASFYRFVGYFGGFLLIATLLTWGIRPGQFRFFHAILRPIGFLTSSGGIALTAGDIRDEIEPRVGKPPTGWTIGVTDDPEGRNKELGPRAIIWHSWLATSEEEAREVEAHYVALGMNRDSDGSGTASYVYIFAP